MDDRTKSSRLAWAAYGLALLIVVADQLSKYWIVAVYGLEARETTPILPFFSLTWVENRGVSFGLFQSPSGEETIRWALAAFSALVAIALAVWARKARRLLLAAAIGLIIGGAIGNLIDRVRYGYVVDFLDFSGLYFPWVFNVADAAINVGVALLLLDIFITGDKDKAAV
jgi:signal peptidase II